MFEIHLIIGEKPNFYILDPETQHFIRKDYKILYRKEFYNTDLEEIQRLVDYHNLYEIIGLFVKALPNEQIKLAHYTVTYVENILNAVR